VILVFTLLRNMKKLAGLMEFKCGHIDISTSSNHGKGHSRITFTFVACWPIDNGEWNEEEYSCTIRNTRCKKDNSKTIMNTIWAAFEQSLERDLHACMRFHHQWQGTVGSE
jgi:hypothetical protein